MRDRAGEAPALRRAGELRDQAFPFLRRPRGGDGSGRELRHVSQVPGTGGEHPDALAGQAGQRASAPEVLRVAFRPRGRAVLGERVKAGSQQPGSLGRGNVAQVDAHVAGQLLGILHGPGVHAAACQCC